MFGRFVLRGAPLALLALTLTSVSASAITVPAPAPAVRMAKISIPGKPLTAFDISWVDSASAHYYLADRTNGTIDVVDVLTNKVTRPDWRFQRGPPARTIRPAPTESSRRSRIASCGQATVIARSKLLT